MSCSYFGDASDYQTYSLETNLASKAAIELTRLKSPKKKWEKKVLFRGIRPLQIYFFPPSATVYPAYLYLWLDVFFSKRGGGAVWHCANEPGTRKAAGVVASSSFSSSELSRFDEKERDGDGT